ncbi:MAG: nucleotidyltransferase domain-containing protein [Candidatus Bathyarchaeia archaeon]|nr:nucleotidyltransferase domain-containing protein [Candidatus Bathyarchaeota archaeon]
MCRAGLGFHASRLPFDPSGLSRGILEEVLRRVKELLAGEAVEYDLCLIGSRARGDASPLSDVDLAMYSLGEPNLRRTEVFWVDGLEVTLFAVDAERLLGSESLEFYAANNPFEARLLHGDGEVLRRLREGVYGRRIDLEATRALLGRTVSMRLLSALSDAVTDIGEGVRNLRVSLAKAHLYSKLMVEGVDPWSLIPYHYRPESPIETMLDELYRSENYDELSSRIIGLNLNGLMEETFKDKLKILINAARMIEEHVGFAGELVENYVKLYLIVEERVRSIIWSRLPGRWRIEEEFSSKIEHFHTNIVCDNKKVYWILSLKGGEGKLEDYGMTTF